MSINDVLALICGLQNPLFHETRQQQLFFYLHSDEGDEIVECDNCGITVHEGES